MNTMTVEDTPTICDSDLLRRYLTGGDTDALGRVVGRHLDMVYGTCLRALSDAHLAEDITQAVFIILAKRAATIERHASVGGWLYKTARFASADARKAQRRRRWHERRAAEMKETTLTSAGPGNDEVEQAREFLERGVAALHSRDRDIIVLRFFEGMSIREVGEVMRVSEDAAKMRVSRAIEGLRSWLARHGVRMTETSLAGAFLPNASVHAPTALLAAAVSSATNSGAAGTVCTQIAGHALQRMMWAKAQVGALVLAGALAGGLALLTIRALAADHPVTAPPPAPAMPAATAPSQEKLHMARTIADAASQTMRSQAFPFLDEAKLAALHAELEQFVTAKGPEGLAPGEWRDVERQLADAVSRYIGGYFPKDAPDDVYLRYRDYVNLMKWQLWLAMQNAKLTEAQAQRLAAQHQWMQDFVSNLPEPAYGKPAGAMRAEALKELEAKFADPMDLLHHPLSDAAFEGLTRGVSNTGGQRRWTFPQPGNAIGAFEFEALMARAPAQKDPSAPQGSWFQADLPFDDRAVECFVNGWRPYLGFASNHQFVGRPIMLDTVAGHPHQIADVSGCRQSNIYLAGRPLTKTDELLTPEQNTWLQEHRNGDLAIDREAKWLATLRGGTVAKLDAKGWLEADQISDAAINTLLQEHGAQQVAIEDVPLHPQDMNKPFPYFYAVRTVDGTRAVARVTRRIVHGGDATVMLHVRV